ncbi:cytochrome-c oxidase, cbb3-type subunit III [Parasphingorhabdus halotolerans]|uniref:Cbb3-type cytochrome c oxidase subunit n=1 Tax=Parasphingorhabdus halotolerans TaxID=2725558 RepID=A0A6H2DQ79_9SPHN|nr:cytochrome-c oxidase, cbb3-type subunit III [Parasphingorhabdus halotolerans]QJB70494.1 cytochrome-c oxidase, cbb3-type subunit III [Parasphingorhabdus halotolerans]
MSDKKYIDEATGTETVGHEWDGIEELDTPMPRWWLWTLYATIIWAIGYVIMYPAIPMLNSATEGVLGWTSRGEYAKEVSGREAELAPIRQAIISTDIRKLNGTPELMQQAIEGGRSAFKVHCVQCHGSGAAGSKGYPNLNDDDWLWGGDLEAIEYTLVHGIRQPDHSDTRFSQMPAFGRDGILQSNEIQDVVSHVRTLSGDEKPSAASQRGALVYAANCVICHGANGKGDRLQGAPNLTDKIALYGRDRATLTETITNSRYGVMPRWNNRLDPVTIRMLAAYVHSLGGGETLPALEKVNQETLEQVESEGAGDEQS